MSAATFGPMPGVSAISSTDAASSASASGSAGEVAAGDAADALDAHAEQHAAERRSLDAWMRSTSRRAETRRCARRHELLGRQPVEVAGGDDQAGALQDVDLLLAEALDVHRALRGEVLEQLPAPRRALPVRAAREHLALALDRRRGARRAGAGGCGGGERSGARRRAARRDDLRDDVAGAGDDHVVALADVLAPQVLLVVQRGELDRDAADVDRLEPGERVQVAVLADVPEDLVQVGELRRRRELPRDRPARVAPDRAEARCSSRSSTLTTTPSISNSSAPRRRSQATHCSMTASRPRGAAMSPLTRKPCSRSHARPSECCVKRTPSICPTA
jgi:hypothetical protein